MDDHVVLMDVNINEVRMSIWYRYVVMKVQHNISLFITGKGKVQY